MPSDEELEEDEASVVLDEIRSSSKKELWPRIAQEVLEKALEARAKLAARAAQQALGKAVERAARRAEAGDGDRRKAIEAAERAKVAVGCLRLIRLP